MASPEVEEDAKEFRNKEWRFKNHQYTEMIDKDIVRTRFLKENIVLHKDVKRILEYYCHIKNVTYCQGMIEVLLPFLFMKQQSSDAEIQKQLVTNSYESKQQFDIAYVYGYFKMFVQLYIPNTLHTKFNGRGTSLPYLKCSLFITELLLQYHDKQLYNHLKTHKLILEMFATSWLLTLFTRVVDFSLVYELWEIFLFERDKYLIFFFAIGMLKSQRKAILKLNSMEKILQFFTTQFKIKDFNQLS